MNKKASLLKSQIRYMIVFFIVTLALSGVTAIPVYDELRILLNYLPAGNFIQPWFQKVFDALAATREQYPFLLYGYDWLAFGHFMIAIAFIGPLRDPVKNRWVIEFGMIACVLVLPYAFICGAMRGIPLGWTLIDCSFGVFGFIPLWICWRKILELTELVRKENLNIFF